MTLQLAEKCKLTKGAKNKSRLNALGTIGESWLMIFDHLKTLISEFFRKL